MPNSVEELLELHANRVFVKDLNIDKLLSVLLRKCQRNFRNLFIFNYGNFNIFLALI